MRALRALVITTLLVGGAACGGDDDATPVTEPTSPATQPPTAEPSTTAAPGTTAEPGTTEPVTTPPPTTEPAAPEPTPTTEPSIVDVRVYFLDGERLFIDHRDVEGPAVLGGALTALLAGPEGGLGTAVPSGTTLRSVNLADGTATIDLSGDFGTGGGSASMFARVAQVVFTATQFDSVERVAFWLDGQPIDALGGEGLAMTEPWTRADVPRDLTGGVLVDSPHPGDTVTSPFVVTGEADVFEAQFPIEIRRGDQILASIAPVTGGSWGNWAEFSTTVTVEAEPGPIELVAYDAGGCGDALECPPIIETVVPLTLS